MFDLEKAIAEWRRQMLAAGLKTPAPLDELESHLREDIRALLATREPADMAFQLAVSRLGNADPLRSEFNKLKNPRFWPVTIGCWFYAGAMMLMAIFVCKGSKMGLIPNLLLLNAHVVSLTAGYCAAFLAGCFGILYVCYRFFHALSPGHRQSLGRAVFLFSHLAAGLTLAGLALGIYFWSKENRGNYLRGNLSEMAASAVSVWLLVLCGMQRMGRLTERATMLLCIGGNVVVAMAWFGPFILVRGMAGFWPLAVFLGMNLVFLLAGLAPSHEEIES
jgi:hypothetical protein